MKPHFIEFTITSDSNGPLVIPRKGMVRHDVITSVVDVSSGDYRAGTNTEITLQEETDYVNDADEVGGVVRGLRTLYVQEDYETVKTRLNEACNEAT